jgi:cytochrome c553
VRLANRVLSGAGADKAMMHQIFKCSKPAALVSFALGLLMTLGVAARSATGAEQIEQIFEQAVRPALVEHCLKCHGPQKQEGNLRLDTHASLLAGGDSGPALVPGDADASLLMSAVRHEGLEMPPNERLDDQAIAAIASWIDAGAVWPEHAQPLRAAGKLLTDEDRAWWAFQPIRKPSVPEVQDETEQRISGLPSHPIDRFVQRRLAERQMTAAPPANPRTLVRRLYFDLIGLPPTPQELQAYLDDDSANAWQNLVDRLLHDPRHGEHAARHWLDVVRYAESDGWNQDAYRDSIFRYRDYVVRAFNDDKPLPDFIREQLAGDELPGDNPESLVAAGFLRLGIYEYNQRNARGHWDSIMNEVTDVTGDVFLGIGMACARCHDHKFDPVLQNDYFRLRAFFEPIVWQDDVPVATHDERQAYEDRLAAWKQETAEIQRQIDALVAPYHERKWETTVDKFPLDIQACFHKPRSERNSWEDQMAYLVARQFWDEGGGPLSGMSKADKAHYEQLQAQLKEHAAAKPGPLPTAMSVRDFPGTIAPTVIPDDPAAEPVAPGVLSVLEGSEAAGLSFPEVPLSTGRRSALADWLGSPRNPLTARVYVNRIWKQHFGRGIVATTNDFGRTGAAPTHPELLDWLAASFMENGWSTKWLRRTILTSSTWQQSAHHPHAESYAGMDPEESLLWRSSVRRLTAEQIRDAMLVVSGELDPRLGGPSVGADSPRRALYLKRFRNTPYESLYLFDVAVGLKSVGERSSTTTPTQALLMINGPFALDRARALADRLQSTSTDRERLLASAFEAAWGRPPDGSEMTAGLDYVSSGQGEEARVDQERLVDFCHVLLNSNEFFYVD